MINPPKPAAQIRDQSVSLGAFKVKKSKKDGAVVSIVPVVGGGTGTKGKGTSAPSVSARPSTNLKKLKNKIKNPVISTLTGTSVSNY